MTLQAALNDLRDSIEADGFDPEMIENIAEEWELNPKLLARKFEERFNCKAENYKGRQDLSELQIETAKATAKAKLVELRQRYRGGDENFVIGKMFNRGPKKYVSIIWTNDGLHCIRVDTNEHMVIKFPNQRVAYKFITKNVR